MTLIVGQGNMAGGNVTKCHIEWLTPSVPMSGSNLGLEQDAEICFYCVYFGTLTRNTL
jgi:hypothetical protein